METLMPMELQDTALTESLGLKCLHSDFQLLTACFILSPEITILEMQLLFPAVEASIPLSLMFLILLPTLGKFLKD